MALLRSLFAFLCACGLAHAQSDAEFNPARRAPAATAAASDTARIIVKLRPAAAVATSRDDAATVTRSHGFAVRRQRALGGDLENVHVALGRGQSLATVLAKLRADRRVLFAEEDRRRYPQAAPNDPLYTGQWFLQAAEPSGIDAVAAWDVTTGSEGVVIADIDTGVRYDHPDLKRVADSGRLLPGYDFVSADSDGGFRTANDGDGRDADASDPGDWINATDKNATLFQDCDEQPSTWHGTRVAGILGALSNNGTGLAGTTWKSWILPVRALGKCGGYDSDILTAMRWAAGLNVAGVSTNAYPARILNLSLGSPGACPQGYQTVVDEIVARGVIIVASAGNEGTVVGTPASCDGVIAVAGLRANGEKVGFSNLGPQITVGAPGGNCVNTAPGSACLFSIDTTTNDGATTPGSNIYGDQFTISVGTSFSAPIVAGVAALMLAVNGNLEPEQIAARLREGAKPFPAPDPNSTTPVCHVPVDATDVQDTTCSCTTSTCGAGMTHAPGAVAAAQRPIAAIEIATANVVAGQDVSLRAGGSAAACNRSLSTYAWTVLGGGANPPTIGGADSANATVAAPSTGTLTVQLTVTDDAGRSDSAVVIITPSSASTTAPADASDFTACLAAIDPTPPPPPTPPPTSGGGGGGGTTGLATLALLALAAARRRRTIARRAPWPAC